MEFGVSRRHGGEDLEERARAFAAVLGLSLRMLDDYDALLAALQSDAVQLAWLPPLLLARAQAAGLRIAAAPERGGELVFRAAILTRREPVALAGLRAAWVDPSSASGYVFPRLVLLEQGATFASEAFLGAAHAAAQAVADGRADVCACFVSLRAGQNAALLAAAVRNELGALAEDLRVLRLTEPIPPDGLVWSRQGDPGVERALLSMHANMAGLQALQGLLRANRLVAADEATQRLAQRWAAPRA